jgi:acyl-CoA synthetase (AMP-forming)/AMP-acid ligase II
MLADPSSTPSLSCVAVGGEALPYNVMQLWTGSRCRLLVTYGVTEVTVYQTIHNVSAAAAHAALSSSSPALIGRALPGVGVAIVGADDSPVPKGQPGQIVLFGPQLAFGYVGQHGAGASGGFRSLDLGARGNVPAYFTGDGGTMLLDEQLVFHGRSVVRMFDFVAASDFICARALEHPVSEPLRAGATLKSKCAATVWSWEKSKQGSARAAWCPTAAPCARDPPLLPSSR